MPLHFCLAIHNALEEVQAQLLPGEHLFAFLDDVCAVSAPERTRNIYDMLADKLFRRAGIRLHNGKTRTWNKEGEVPERMPEMGPEVWSPAGLKILGTAGRVCRECDPRPIGAGRRSMAGHPQGA